MLTTAFYLAADWRTGKMRFANAGHPKPLLLHPPQAKSSRSSTLPPGASRRSACSTTRLIKPVKSPSPRVIW
jgi:serine phosphatase RsbU (regulator of sigma subunit)